MPREKPKIIDLCLMNEDAFAQTQFHAVPLDWIPFEQPLAADLFIHIVDRKILFRKQGDELLQTRMQLLRRQGVDVLYVTADGWKQTLDQMQTIFQKFSNRHPQSSISQLRAYTLAFLRNIELTKALDSKAFSNLLALGDFIAHSALKNPEFVGELLKRYQDSSLYYSNHQVNTGIFSALIGVRLGLREIEIRTLTLAGLTHNVGNLLVPEKVLLKTGTLLPEEFAKIKAHPVHGSNYLQSLGAPEVVCQVAAEHHEQPDGKGYPYGLRDRQIHLFSKVVAVADVYDALTNLRPHRNERLVPDAAIREMQVMHGKFSPKVFKTLTGIKK